MKLRLSTVAFRGIAPVHPQIVEATNEELTIGRSPDNTFVLEDPERYCSRYHARCYVLNGTYFIEDSSSSGTLINESQMLERGHRYQLQQGDTLIIGENQLKVELIEAPSQQAAPSPTPQPAATGAFSIDDFFQGGPAPEEVESRPSETAPLPRIPTTQADDFLPTREQAAAAAPEFDFSDLANLDPDSPSEHSPAIAPEERHQPAESTTIDDCATAPTKGAASGSACHSTSSTQVATPPQQSPTPAPEAAPDAIDSLAIKAFLQGLDLNPEDLIGLDKVEIMQSAGQMLNTLTGGLIDILQARSDVKKEFSMDVTRIQATRNNPLKFCGSAEEALLKLLTRDSAYLDPAESVYEGVIDAKAHQIAIMAGMQAALESLLQRFDPSTLEKQLDRRFLLSKKARYWELYTEAFNQLVDEAEENFQSLFGEEFARTYQEQVKQVAAKGLA